MSFISFHIINLESELVNNQIAYRSSMLNPQYRKVSRIPNPFQSSESLTSNFSQSNISQFSPKKYQQTKFPNLFQYNDRQKIYISDSQNGSSVMNNQSGENIFPFHSHIKQKTSEEKVLDIPLKRQEDKYGYMQENNNHQRNQKQNVKKPINISKDRKKQGQIKFTPYKVESPQRFSFNPTSQKLNNPQQHLILNINNYQVSTKAQRQNIHSKNQFSEHSSDNQNSHKNYKNYSDKQQNVFYTNSNQQQNLAQQFLKFTYESPKQIKVYNVSGRNVQGQKYENYNYDESYGNDKEGQNYNDNRYINKIQRQNMDGSFGKDDSVEDVQIEVNDIQYEHLNNVKIEKQAQQKPKSQITQPQPIKKGFKPSLLKKYQQSQKLVQPPANQHKQSLQLVQPSKIFYLKSASQKQHPIPTNQPSSSILQNFHQQSIGQQNIFILHNTNTKSDIKSNLKNNIPYLEQNKLNLSNGSQAHTYTDNILDKLKSQNNQSGENDDDFLDLKDLISNERENKKKQNQQTHIHFNFDLDREKQTKYENSKENIQKNSSKNKEKQKTFLAQSKYISTQQHKKNILDTNKNLSSTGKRQRKKIFDSKNDSTHHTHSNNFIKSQHPHSNQYHKNQSVMVSSFNQNVSNSKNKNQECEHSKCLLKSLQIIQKMTLQKQQQRIALQTQRSKFNAATKQDRVIVVPPPTLTISHSPKSKTNRTYSPSSEQMKFRQQILQLNFQLANFQSTFDLQQFDKKYQIRKVNQFYQSTLHLFEQYKTFVLTNSSCIKFSESNINSDGTQISNTLKNQILALRQQSTKFYNMQQKYILTKQVLNSLESEIKNILLLSSKEKYKKIKLLNDVIMILEKTQTYLALDTGKIPAVIKTYIAKQKLLLQELRDWLKECFNKANAIHS